jgi:hypothetical protein
MRAGAWPTWSTMRVTAQLVHGHGRARVRAVAEKGARILEIQSSRRRAPGGMRRRRAAVASMAVAWELGRRLLFFLVPIAMHQRRRTRQQLTSTAAR